MAAHSPQRPVLVAVASDEAAARWDSLSDAALVDSALAALHRMFPGKAPALPRQHLVSRWGLDPWSRGSLSYYAANSSGPGDRATLAEPQSGSLILAGEAVWPLQPSTVAGALLSGREAAQRVLEAAAELPVCGGGSVCALPGGATLRCHQCDADFVTPLA